MRLSLRLPFDTPSFRTALARYRQAQQDPWKVQEELLRRILKRNKGTAYGKKHGFSTISSYEDYRKRVPVVTYEDLLPYIDCMLQDMRNVLVKDRIVYFATTSGTTSRPKLIPITIHRTRQLRQELLLWAFFMLQRDLRKGLVGKTLYFAGPIREDLSIGGTLMGSISGYMAWKSPFWARTRLVIPPDYYNEMNFEKKTRMIALKALSEKNITQLGFAAPIEAILFLDYLKKHRKSLIATLERTGRRTRARQLAKIAEFTPAKIWPGLSLVNCIKSETNIPYLRTLEEKIGKSVTIRDPGIFASEGRLTLGLTDHDRAGVLVAQENFFEFLERKVEGEYGKPLTVDKIKQGRSYKVLLTTQEGLYRYDIGDVLEVVGFKGKLPIMRFVQREHFLNIVGEFSPENQLLEAMAEACEQLNLKTCGYTFLPYMQDLSKRPCYELLVEPADGADTTALHKLAKTLDAILKRRIQDYRQMREEFGRLGHLRVAIVKPGTYEAIEKERLTRAGQPKPLRIAKDPSVRQRFAITKEYVPEDP